MYKIIKSLNFIQIMNIYENQHEQLWKSWNNHEDLCKFIQINEHQHTYTQILDNNVNDAHITNIYDNMLKNNTT